MYIIIILLLAAIFTAVTMYFYKRRPFVFGPIQREWIDSLRAHPERQGKGELGRKYKWEDNSQYYACCLGEGGIIAGVCKWSSNGILKTIEGEHIDLLHSNTFKSLGLRTANGEAKNKKNYQSLATLNDTYSRWSQIADILEKNPRQYFTHSV